MNDDLQEMVIQRNGDSKKVDFQEMVSHRWHFFTRQKLIREFQGSGLFTNEMVSHW